ncbi:hypothetical protein Sste5346_002955 [Sporothrix stenoceras]|uniref:Uncharacterized protein n=1 Tax=Sporothrix stenoceras TaxID=5173 RepID=A0ABR3ZFR3_9PEZI
MSGRNPSPVGGGNLPPSAGSSSTPLQSPALATANVPPPQVTHPGLSRSTSASAVPSPRATESPSVVPALRPTATVQPCSSSAPPAPTLVLAPAPATAHVQSPAPMHIPASTQAQPARQYLQSQPSQQQLSRQSIDSDIVERRWQEPIQQQHQQTPRAQSMPQHVQTPPLQPQQHQQPSPQQQWRSSQSPFPANQTLPPGNSQPHQPPHGPPRPPDPVVVRRAPIVNPPLQVPPPARAELVFVDPRGGIPHPSPGHDYPRENPKIQDDYMRLTFAIEQSVSDAVRCAMRQNWQKCLLGTGFHQGFMLNALLDSVPPDVARGSVKDFGAKVVKNARVEFAAHLDTADIDEIAGLILAKASDRFLDAALEARLRTIDAKPLINALARAERLGYEPDDIVEEPVGGQERVIPQNLPEPQLAVPTQAPPPRKQCKMCNRVFDNEPPYVYHDSTGACTKYDSAPKDAHAPKPAAPRPSVATPSVPATNGAVRNHSIPPETLLPATRPIATPVRQPLSRHVSELQSSQQSASPPGSGQKNPAADPYAHLSEEQLAALNEELLKAEKIYSEKFREAELITNPLEKQTLVNNLRNSFGTRQSIIRKKWGVRLRERRTKAEIEAERVRMGLANDFSPVPGSSQAGPSYNSIKRMRTNDGSQHGSGSRSFESNGLRRKTPTPGYPLLETPRAQPLPRPADNEDDNMSDSSSDNDDIPARLPDSVRQSLSASQRM